MELVVPRIVLLAISTTAALALSAQKIVKYAIRSW
jgi:hypothetical protein